MKLSEIIKRLAEIAEELTKLKARLEEEDVDVDDVEEKSNKLIEERDGLLAQKKELEGKAEKRQSLLDKIASGQVGTVIRDNGDRSGTNSNDKLYRSAWLKNLQGKESWERHMIARKRKTIAVCRSCHKKIHDGKID